MWKKLVLMLLIFSICSAVYAAGPCGEGDAGNIVISARSEYSRNHTYETDGRGVRTLNYKYIKGVGWKGSDGSVYARTSDGWKYTAPEAGAAHNIL